MTNLVLTVLLALFGSDPARLIDWSKSGTGGRVELSRALSEADLMHLASGALVEALLLGRTESKQVGDALDLYPLSLRGRPTPPRSLLALARFPDAGLSPSQRSRRAFLAGQALLAASRPGEAIAQLAQVAPGSPAYAPGRYLLGVASATPPLNDLASAARHFEAAIVEAEAAPMNGMTLVRDAWRLSTLNLARVAYEVGNYEVSLYYYQRLPWGSPERVEAAFEMAWANIMRGDMHRALGAVHAARAPGILHPLRPELDLVSGAALMALCQYGRAKVELERLDTAFLSQMDQVRSTLSRLDLNPEAGAGRALLGPGSALPPRIRGLVRQTPAVRSALEAARELADERKHLTAIEVSPGVNGAMIEALAEALESTYGEAVDLAVRRALRTMSADAGRMSAARAELMIDVLEDETKVLTTAIQEGQAKAAGPREVPTPALGEDWQQWSFDGEFWPDEAAWYRSTLPSLCQGEEEHP